MNRPAFLYDLALTTLPLLQGLLGLGLSSHFEVILEVYGLGLVSICRQITLFTIVRERRLVPLHQIHFFDKRLSVYGSGARFNIF